MERRSQVLPGTTVWPVDYGNARLIQIDVPIVGEQVSEAEIPADLPGLRFETSQEIVGMNFEAGEHIGNLTLEIEIATGQIQNWPTDRESRTEIHLHVNDTGTYSLLDGDGNVLLSRTGYVPNRVVPGDWGDDIDLLINPEGLIENWPETPDLSEFEEG